MYTDVLLSQSVEVKQWLGDAKLDLSFSFSAQLCGSDEEWRMSK